MPDIPPVPPGIREIDPDAEAARLAALRKREFSHILCHSIVQVPPEWQLDDESDRPGIQIVVTSTLPHPLAEDPSARIREVIWDSMRRARDCDG